MDLLQAIILSIVEGATEFLPVSSTGHLVLTSKILNISQTEFVKSFEIIIQLGAILAVASLYFEKIVGNYKLWKNLAAAFLPTAIVGLVFYQVIKNYLIGNLELTLTALFLGGLVLLFVDKWIKSKSNLKSFDKLSLKQSFVIGLFQSVSVIPGVSRAAATIIGGIYTGLSKKDAVEFSFLLALPTMAAATGLDLVKSDFNFTADETLLIIAGLSGSFLTALVFIKWFVNFVEKKSFFVFGVYRIILSILFYLIFLN